MIAIVVAELVIMSLAVVVVVEADLMEVDAAETDMMDGRWEVEEEEEHPYALHLCFFVVVDSVAADFENKSDTLDWADTNCTVSSRT